MSGVRTGFTSPATHRSILGAGVQGTRSAKHDASAGGAF